MKLSDDIQTLKGIGPKSAKLYAKLGIFTLSDLITYYPRDYERYDDPKGFAQAKPGENLSVYAKVTSAPTLSFAGKYKLVTCKLVDAYGTCFSAKWFNQPYLRSTLKTGMAYVFRGRVSEKGYGKVLEQPQIFTKERYNELSKKLLPIYPLTKGLSRDALMKSEKAVLSHIYETFGDDSELPGRLPAEVEKKYKLLSYLRAIEEIHFPSDEKSYIRARDRIVFEEFYDFFVDMRTLKSRMRSEKNAYPTKLLNDTDELIKSLPYCLTGAQEKTLFTIRQEMAGSSVVHRLIQGDVGSGKTIVAFLCMYEAALNGYQAALMAPTEVLAVQHFNELNRLLQRQNMNVRTSLLVGSLTAAERREVHEKIKNHETDIIIGTHALFQDDVIFERLGLVITDEQHRFGVNQRKSLSKKGGMPHCVYMSATPIPRSLAGVLYADMDVSIIDEKPTNRLEIKSCVVDTTYRPNAYAFIKRELKAGHQAYIICSLVEESELMDGENVVDYAAKMKEIFGSEMVGVLHGRMSAEMKRGTMEDFASGKTKILVSTTVVEVGVDVSNATVMLIEDAQRFGLAQLHQLRGRVGRGDAQSYCIFIDTKGDPEDNERLKVMNSSNDGFFIAAEDLRLRGPGDLFGIRQSGELEFKLADIYRDSEIMNKAAEAASGAEGVFNQT